MSSLTLWVRKTVNPNGAFINRWSLLLSYKFTSEYLVCDDGLNTPVSSQCDTMLCQQRALEWHCSGRGASIPGSCVPDLAFHCSRCMFGQQYGCIGTSSSSQSLSDLKAQPRSGDHLSNGPPDTNTICFRFYAPKGIPVPVCTHMTALVWLHPRELFSAWPTMDPLKFGQPGKLGKRT